MKVQFYSSFDKRSNSTAVPTTTTYIESECVLKAPCSVLHPVLQIDLNTAEWAEVSNPHSYNYVKIPDFDRWFYVTTWNAANQHIWICELDVDPLASWKDEIGSQSLYVLRSSNIYDNGIIDTTYPAMAVYTRGSNTATSPLHIEKITDGNYVVGIINSASSGTGAVSYYVFTHSQLKTLLNKLMGDTTWAGIEDITAEISTELSKMLFNPFQYVVSCMWFPFSVPTGTAVQDLPYGWWELEGVPCSTLAAGANKIFTVSVNVPKHPKASTRGRTVESSLFSKYTLTFEPYGCISIDSALLYGQGTLYMIGVVDLITGDSTLFLNTTQYNTANNNIMTLNSKIGVPVQLAQIGINANTGVTTMLAGAVAGAAQAVTASTGGPGALIKNAASGIADGVAASMMGLQSAGSNGSFSVYFASNVELAAIFYDIADRDLDHHGAPLCTTTTLSRIPGYLMISDADVYIPCYPEELEAIQRALTTGFYLEDVSTPPVPEAVIEQLSITENGTYTATGSIDGYSPVVVNVPQGITPTGTIEITENGSYDVTEFASALVNVSGGGSLPSSISKIDGGSFTPSSNQSAETYRINHNLGELPKYCVVWTEELTDGTPVDTNYAVSYGILRIGSYFTSSTAEQYAMVNVHGRSNGGGNNASANTGTQAQLANFASTTYFAMRKSGLYYKAGVKYNWLAWA